MKRSNFAPCLFLAFASLAVQALPGAAGQQPGPPSKPVGAGQPNRVPPPIRQGYSITPDVAAQLEEGLTKDPEDVEARAKLLGYYFARGGRGVPAQEARQARLRHILWLIEHHPDSDLLSGSEATIDPVGHPLADADDYAKARAAWLEQTEKHKNSTAVLGNAAWFFKMPDKEIAADLFKRAHSLQPQEPSFPDWLGFVYATGILGVTSVNQNRFPTGVDPELAKGPVAQKFREELAKCDDPAVTGAAAYALAFEGMILASTGKAPSDVFELAEKYLTGALAANPGNSGLQGMLSQLYQTLAMHAASPELRAAFMKKRLAVLEMAPASSDSQQRLDQLPGLVQAAFDAGEMEKATNYAGESLRLAADHQDQRDYDTAVHKANIVLGRMALRQNNVEKAKTYLLTAGHAQRRRRAQLVRAEYVPGQRASRARRKGRCAAIPRTVQKLLDFFARATGSLDRRDQSRQDSRVRPEPELLSPALTHPSAYPSRGCPVGIGTVLH